jgi:hypothetical protein
MLVIEKAKAVLLRPSYFFRAVKNEVGIIEAFKYNLILSIFYMVMSFISSFLLSYLFYSIFSGMGYYPSQSIMPMYGIYSIFTLLIYGFLFFGLIIGPFIVAAIMHVLTIIFGGRGNFSSTYKVTIYSDTAVLVFGWFPYIGPLSYLYSLYLYIKGLSILHNISMGRAFLITMIPLVAIIVLISLIFLYILGIFYNTPAIGTTPVWPETTIPSQAAEFCTNHAQCSQVCSHVCPQGIYGCCVNGNLGQCTLDTGECRCVTEAKFCDACPSCDYTFEYCDGYSKKCKSKSMNPTGFFWSVMNKLPFFSEL